MQFRRQLLRGPYHSPRSTDVLRYMLAAVALRYTHCNFSSFSVIESHTHNGRSCFGFNRGTESYQGKVPTDYQEIRM